MKIKVKEIILGCFPCRTGGEVSDCYDLYLAEPLNLKKGDIGYFRLGVAMELPKGMTAKIYSRSSTPKKYGLEIPNGLGFIDNYYNGNNDEWKIGVHATKNVALPAGTRICQFEVCLSQFATVWQKLRWLFSNKITLEKVDQLSNKNRGGIGSTNNN